MIVVSPPPSPASRFKALNLGTSTPATGGHHQQEQHQHTSSSSSMQGNNNTNDNTPAHARSIADGTSTRSTPSPRLANRHASPSIATAAATAAPPKPAQLQRLHAQVVGGGSASTVHSGSPSPISSGPPSPKSLSGGGSPSLLPLDHHQYHYGNANANAVTQPPQGRHSPRHPNITLVSNSSPQSVAGATSPYRSSPPMTPSSPVHTSLLFSSPGSHGINNGYINDLPLRQASSSLPPFTSGPSSSAMPLANNVPPTTRSVQSSPRPHHHLHQSRLSAMTSPRSINTSHHHGGGASMGSSSVLAGATGLGNASPGFPSPGLQTARPPLSFHNTGTTSTSSGSDREREKDSASSARNLAALTANSLSLVRSSTRSPPPTSHAPLLSASANIINHNPNGNIPPYTTSSSISNSSNASYNPYAASNSGSSLYQYNRPTSPDDSTSNSNASLSSSAYAYTASNTTNSLSHAFHSALQAQREHHTSLSQQQAGQQQQQQRANDSSHLPPPRRQGTDTSIGSIQSSLLSYPRPAGSSASLASQNSNLYAPSSSAASSRHPSRRPSAVTLQSFLEGVNHVTRVRSPSLRGHSRSGSFDDFESVAGSSAVSRTPSSILSFSSNKTGGDAAGTGGSSRPWHLDDVDEVPSWEEHNRTFKAGNGFAGNGNGSSSAASSRAVSPTPRNRSFFTGYYNSGLQARHRNGSHVSLRAGAGAGGNGGRDLYTPENEHNHPVIQQTSPLPIGISNANGKNLSANIETYDDEYDEYAERTFVDRRNNNTLFPDHIRDEDEQRHLRNLEEQEHDIDHYSTHSGGGRYLSGDDPSAELANSWSDADLNSLQEGDRLGIGLLHEGHLIVDALEGGPSLSAATTGDNKEADGAKSPARSLLDDGIQFEIVRQLGYGSYAIVYLVKEILYEPSHEIGRRQDDHHPFSTTDEDAFLHDDEEGETIYGREFALKCLSKKNLTDEQIAVQKFEATLHRALPNHPNVVALHRAMETPAWLFLVLEYCPGQDLFFWLEQARDHEELDLDPSRAPSRMSSSRAPVVPAGMIQQAWHQHSNSGSGSGANKSGPPSPPLGQSPAYGSQSFQEKHEHTPPSPSLLSANTDTALLSRRRLRLISRMFVQMCEALQACHDAGVSHRDIKPENIIIVDNRAELGSAGKVVIKITDWGLGTTDERCEDFDCGSKPYMAYECRNNLMPSYEPRGADVWSLGIVLLNLLFHRCPWADPTLDDPDFCAFRRDPIGFLETRFEGIGTEVASFLANRVFCDVEEMGASPEPVDTPLPSSVATATPASMLMQRGIKTNKRVTAGEFAKWANKLVRYMGEGSRRASISDSTYQIVHTVRQSPRIDGGGAAGAGRTFHSPPARSPRNSVEIHRTSYIEGSPSRKTKRLSANLPNDLMEELDKGQPELVLLQQQQNTATVTSAPEHPSPLTQSLMEEKTQETRPDGYAHSNDDHNVDNVTQVTMHLKDDGVDSKHDEEHAALGEVDEATREEQDAENAAKEKSRRRKRGARKGKGHREKGDGSEPATSPQRSRSGTLNLLDANVVDGERVESALNSPESPNNINLSETSETLQAYAREISQSTQKPPLVTSISYPVGGPADIASIRQTRSSAPPMPTPASLNVRPAAAPPPSKSRFSDKLRSAFANGNPELQAFAARAKERDMGMNGVGERNPTASAPAKLQHSTASFANSSQSQLSSFGSVASSTGSWSEDGAAGKHWASTSSRRTRVDRTKRPSDDPSAASVAATAGALASSRPSRSAGPSRHQVTRDQTSTSGSSPSPSRRSFTPLSSFSSVTSYDARSQVGGHVSGSSPSGVRAVRYPLQSIDETASAASREKLIADDDLHHDATRTPLAGSILLDDSAHRRDAKPAAAVSHVVREPKPPPIDVNPPTKPKMVSLQASKNITPEISAVVEPAPAAPPSKAKIGRFFNKFSRS